MYVIYVYVYFKTKILEMLLNFILIFNLIKNIKLTIKIFNNIDLARV